MSNTNACLQGQTFALQSQGTRPRNNLPYYHFRSRLFYLALIRSASLLRFAFPLAAVAVFDGTQVRLCELFFFLVLYQSSRLREREKIYIFVLSSPSVSYGFNGPSCYSPVLNSRHVAGFVQLILLLYTRYFLTRFVEHEALRFFRDFGFESASGFLSLYLRP